MLDEMSNTGEIPSAECQDELTTALAALDALPVAPPTSVADAQIRAMLLEPSEAMLDVFSVPCDDFPCNPAGHCECLLKRTLNIGVLRALADLLVPQAE